VRRKTQLGHNKENPMERHAHHSYEPKTEDDLWITPEQSIFSTRIPRPTHVGFHLAFAFCMFIAASVIAFFHAAF
jgi:hypothetical protein